jgi:hypothetical protein
MGVKGNRWIIFISVQEIRMESQPYVKLAGKKPHLNTGERLTQKEMDFST